MEDRLIWAGAMMVIVGFYATPLFPLWLIIQGLKMKRYLVLLLMCSPAMAQVTVPSDTISGTPETVMKMMEKNPTMTTADQPPTTTIVTTGPVTIGTCKEAAHSRPKIRKAIKGKQK